MPRMPKSDAERAALPRYEVKFKVAGWVVYVVHAEDAERAEIVARDAFEDGEGDDYHLAETGTPAEVKKLEP